MSKVCPHCDYPNFDDAKTCRRCRRDLPRPCPECGGAIAAGAGFCTHCGAIFDKKVDTSVYRKGPASPGDEPGEATNVRPIASRPVKLKHCMECGHTVDIRAVFCIYCGTKFEMPAKPAAPPEPAPPRSGPAAARPGDASRPAVPGKPLPAAPAGSPGEAPGKRAPHLRLIRPEDGPEPAEGERTARPALAAPGGRPLPSVPPRPQPGSSPLGREGAPSESAAKTPVPRPAPRPPAPAGREAAVDPDKTGIFEGSDAARAAARALFAESLPSEADEIEEEAREDESADDLDDEYDRSLIEMVVETVMPDHEPAGLVPLAERTAWTDFASIPAREPSLAQEDMIEIAAGECAVGDRVVRTGSFFIDRAPVTNAQYRRFVDETGVEPPVHWLDGRPIRGTENYPVVNVTFEAVQAFARWAGKRLPRESEWERAARGSDGRDYPWGDAMDEARCHVDDARGCLVAVDAFPEGASPWGCLDMLGNAGEWVVEDGTDAPVIRGGSYRIPAGLLTLRTRLLPYDGSGSAYVGFRCAWGED